METHINKLLLFPSHHSIEEITTEQHQKLKTRLALSSVHAAPNLVFGNWSSRDENKALLTRKGCFWNAKRIAGA